MARSRTPLRVAIIGTARRSDYLYGPIVQALPEDVELVAVWGRSADSAKRLGKALGVPAYTELERLQRETAPQIGIVSVNYHANGQVGLMAVVADPRHDRAPQGDAGAWHDRIRRRPAWSLSLDQHRLRLAAPLVAVEPVPRGKGHGRHHRRRDRRR